MIWAVFLLFLLHGISIVITEKGELKGCFKHDVNNKQMTKPNSPIASYSVDKCIEACVQAYHMYAALQDAKYCFCGAKYDTLGPSENCTSVCHSNKTQLCGGVESDSVYSTGLMTPSPPTNLNNISATDKSIYIRWDPPENINGGVKSYKVMAQILSTYDNDQDQAPPQIWSATNTTFKQSVGGLLPGSKYNISVQAISDYGDGPAISAILWTEVGYPDNPPPPQILNRESIQKMSVKLPILQLKTGPLSWYRVVVYDENRHETLNEDRLMNYTFAKKLKIPYYITAELSATEATIPFTVGDGGTYKGYFNAPLADDKVYTVIVGVVSTLNGITRASYSKPAVLHAFFGDAMAPQDIELTTPEHAHRPAIVQKDNGHNAVVIGLLVAIAIGSVLLLASILGFLYMKHYFKRNNQSSDHQELTVHQMSEASENAGGITSSVLYVNDEVDITEVFENVKARLWQIPRSHLEISDHILGEGKFGQLWNGIAHRDGQQIPVLVHTCPAYNSLSDSNRRTLTYELDAMAQMGTHTNAVAIVGASEEQSQLHIAMEQHQILMKDVLLESRALEYYPVFAEKHGKFSTFKEEQLIEFALGVAQGMAHLAQNKIIHGRLCSWHVKILEGTIPKVSHFGLAQYEDVLEKIDYARWSSLESLRGKYSTKSDVWSFAVLLWEIITLGGTPYSTIKCSDVSMRITRGMRLKQPDYVGDDLYQLLLKCWQIDPDERPTFSDIVSQLRHILTTDFANMGHIRLGLYAGFQYEKYDMELEKCNKSSTGIQV